MSNAVLEQMQETVNFIKSVYPGRPCAGMILGSGLGNLVNEIEIEAEIPYGEIPHFPVSTVKGHSGKLLFGKLSGKTVVVMAGRFHYYEGYMAQHIAYPIRILKQLGISTLFVSNAAGGVNTSFKVGDLMIIEDHISLFIQNPLLGTNIEEIGTRFPDMTEPYNKEYIEHAKKIALENGFDIKQGVYTGLTGPSFETRAEYKLIKTLGGDAVGMSTVQEVITAVHAGLKVFAVSVITNIGIKEEQTVNSHEDVLASAKNAEPKLGLLFKEMVKLV